MIVVSHRSTDAGRATCLRAWHPGATRTLVALPPHKKFRFGISICPSYGNRVLSLKCAGDTKIDLELYQRSTAASKDAKSSSVLTWLSSHHTPSTPHGPRSSCYLKTQVNTIAPNMEPNRIVRCPSMTGISDKLASAR